MPQTYRPSKHCHQLVRATAIEMAGELYERVMHDDGMYSAWKARWPGRGAKQLEALFLQGAWPTLVGQARGALAGMLARPIDEKLKDEIHEALCLDGGLMREELPSFVLPSVEQREKAPKC